MLSTSIEGQGMFSCQRHTNDCLPPRRLFSRLQLKHTSGQNLSHPGLSLVGRAGRRATVGISDVESSVDRVAMGESASGCGGKRRSLIRVDTSGRRSSSVQ